jgi:hypothetical protein
MTISRNLALHAQYINSSGILSSNAIGSNFQGVWSSTTAYAVNDIVSWTNGYYICLIAHTNEIPYDGLRSGKWKVFIKQNLNWRGDWTSTTDNTGATLMYYVNDVVKYNNAIYVCTFNHVPLSTAIPATDSSWTSLTTNSLVNQSNRLTLSTNAPIHSYGVAGDIQGMIAFDSSYIYYCTANYVNNTTDIWKRIALVATSW